MPDQSPTQNFSTKIPQDSAPSQDIDTSAPDVSNTETPPAFQLAKKRRRAKMKPEKSYISAEEAEILRQIADVDGPETVIDPFTLKMQSEKDKRYLRIFKKTIKYGGDLTRALMEEGYSENSPNQPARIMKNKTWQMIMDHYFPAELLAKKDLELLNHKDWRATNAALERLHKLRGDFTKKIEISVSRDDDYRRLSDDELRNVIEGEVVEEIMKVEGEEEEENDAS
jgi:hypothetical protein